MKLSGFAANKVTFNKEVEVTVGANVTSIDFHNLLDNQSNLATDIDYLFDLKLDQDNEPTYKLGEVDFPLKISASKSCKIENTSFETKFQTEQQKDAKLNLNITAGQVLTLSKCSFDL
jgi:hypothetical protein